MEIIVFGLKKPNCTLQNFNGSAVNAAISPCLQAWDTAPRVAMQPGGRHARRVDTAPRVAIPPGGRHARRVDTARGSAIPPGPPRATCDTARGSAIPPGPPRATCGHRAASGHVTQAAMRDVDTAPRVAIPPGPPCATCDTARRATCLPRPNYTAPPTCQSFNPENPGSDNCAAMKRNSTGAEILPVSPRNKTPYCPSITPISSSDRSNKLYTRRSISDSG